MCCQAVDNPGRGRAPLQAKPLMFPLNHPLETLSSGHFWFPKHLRLIGTYWHPVLVFRLRCPLTHVMNFRFLGLSRLSSQPMNQIRPPSLELAATKDGQGPAGHSPGANRFPQQLTSAILRKENVLP